MDTIDVLIIGSGPAGYTAAIYSSRAFLKTVLVTGFEPGGQLTTTTEVENFPGFPDGKQGPELMEDMRKQAERFGTGFLTGTVTAIDTANVPFRVTVDGTTILARTIILATGATAQYLGLPSETRLRGKGVSACATCDGFFFRGKSVAVIGGGDTAMEEATFLTKFASHVTIVHRRDVFRASQIMLDKARNNEKITILANRAVVDIVGDQSVSGLTIRDTVSNREETLPVEGVFVAIGHKPNTEFLRGIVRLDDKGYVLVAGDDPNAQPKKTEPSVNRMLFPQTETSVEGIFAAGDCVDPRYRQAIVAAGQGCMAAMDAEKWLAEKGSSHG